MEAAHLIYSTANTPGSYDSWDIENLKYLRSLEEGFNANKNGNGSSYKSTCGSKSSIRSRSRLSVINLLESLEFEAENPEPQNLQVQDHHFSETESSKTVTLDTCYVLDVVTVRNESVLANPIPKPPGLTISTGLHNISSGGSDGYDYETPTTDTNSSAGNSPMIPTKIGNEDSNDTHSEQRKINFFEEEEEVYGSYNQQYSSGNSRETSPSSSVNSKDPSRASSIISVPYLFPFPVLGTRSRSISITSQGTCPYCGDQSSSVGSNESRLSMSSIGTNYYKSNYPETEADEISMIPTVGGDLSPYRSSSSSPFYQMRIPSPKKPSSSNKPAQGISSPSPTQNNGPFTNSPSNFGMDHQGQLYIDYSPNWDGLDEYIKQIKKLEECKQ